MSSRQARYEERCQQLAARAELERAQIRHGGAQMHGFLAPVAVPARGGGRGRAKAIALLAIMVPLLGAARSARWLRLAQLSVGAWRVLQGLRRP